MQPYPHVYHARVAGDESGVNHSTSPNLPILTVAGPVEFDGPGDQWSPETLICATAANCLLLTFRAVARASSFKWLQLSCDVQGTLDRDDGVARFTHFAMQATLTVPQGANLERATAGRKSREGLHHRQFIARHAHTTSHRGGAGIRPAGRIRPETDRTWRARCKSRSPLFRRASLWDHDRNQRRSACCDRRRMKLRPATP